MKLNCCQRLIRVSKHIEGMQDANLELGRPELPEDMQRYVDTHPQWPHITAMRQHIVDQLHQTLVDALDDPTVPTEQVEIVAQLTGQVALGEIEVTEL